MEQYDLIVAGGGLSGVAAAVARQERGHGCCSSKKNANLGGAASNCLINPFMKYSLKKKDATATRITNSSTADCSKRSRTGCVRRARSTRAICSQSRSTSNTWKKILEDLCEESGVELLYNTTVTAADVAEGNVQSVTVFNCSGFSKLTAKYYIDCTGGWRSVRCGGGVLPPGQGRGPSLPAMTLCFWISNVDMEQFRKDRTQHQRCI